MLELPGRGLSVDRSANCSSCRSLSGGNGELVAERKSVEALWRNVLVCGDKDVGGGVVIGKLVRVGDADIGDSDRA
jgi:hypothetical protein